MQSNFDLAPDLKNKTKPKPTTTKTPANFRGLWEITVSKSLGSVLENIY